MEEYIPSGGFFTPKRPSFRFTGPGNQYNRGVYVGLVNSNGNGQQQQHQHHNQRRANIQGTALFSSRPYYSPHVRFGNSSRGDPNLPVYFQHQNQHYFQNFSAVNHNNHQYHQQPSVHSHHHRFALTPRGQTPGSSQGASGSFSEGMFTPLQGPGSRTNVCKRAMMQTRGDDETEREPTGSSESTPATARGGNAEISESAAGLVAGPVVPPEQKVAEVGHGHGVTPVLLVPRDRNSSVPDIRTAQESAESLKKKRPCPTQIPMHAIQYANDMTVWHALRQMHLEEIQMRMYSSEMRNGGNAAAAASQEYQVHEDSTSSSQEKHQDLEIQQPMIVATETSRSSEGSTSSNGSDFPANHREPGNIFIDPQRSPRNFLNAARLGFKQFHDDYLTIDPPREPVFPGLPPINTAVDDSDFDDPRPVKNFTCGERDYRLFEDRNNSVGHIMRDVYNMNDMDCYDTQEICGVKILPKTLQTWPLEAIGSDWGVVKKHIVNFTGGFGSCGVAPLDSGRNASHNVNSTNTCEEKNWGEVGALGVGALANLFATYQGVREYPLSLIKYVGLNVDKLVKDLDNPNPILPSFSGPLADRNQLVDPGFSDVFRGFPEYELPLTDELDAKKAYEWRQARQIKKLMFKQFSFETLLYIFYTIPGDALQVQAANEIYTRGWRYHKSFNVWITPWVPGMSLNHVGYCETTEKWESGTYKYFHYGKWRFLKGEFKVNDCVVEGAPPVCSSTLWE